jgi:hypothetical protein
LPGLEPGLFALRGAHKAILHGFAWTMQNVHSAALDEPFIARDNHWKYLQRFGAHFKQLNL